MRLKAKLLTFFLFVILLSGTLIIWLSKMAVHAILIEEVAKRGILKTADLPEATVSGFRTESEDVLLPLLQAGMERVGAVYALALDPTGRVLAHTNVLEKGKVYQDRATLEALRLDRPRYRQIQLGEQPVLDVSLPVWAVRQAGSGEEFLLFGGKELKESTRLGTLRLGLPIREALEMEERISKQVVLIITASGGLALGLALLLMRRILGRVRLLAEGTERISQGQYGARVPVLSKDELGDLANSFNRMSEALASAYKNLEDQVKARTQELESFVYTVSHDLKSPVVSLQGMASIFLEDYMNKLDEKGKHYLERLIANANYMEELINGLLTLSRIGRKRENPEIADLRTVLQEIMEIHKERLAEGRIEVVIDPSLPYFVFDRVQLTQLFQNLITNAAKFMGGQPHPAIEVGGRELQDWLEFYVKDNGIGIDPAYHESIFGIFQRLKEVDVDGTGVGLAIVKKIMDIAGGKIWLESKKGEGATFFLRFPKKENPRL